MKKILLIAPSFYTYPESIAEELRLQGWEVTMFDERPSNTTITKVLLRLGLDVVLKKKIGLHYENILDEIKQNKYSKIFFINIETVTADILKKIKKLSPSSELLLYMWDSSKNKPKFSDLILFFDRSYSFDLADSKSNINLCFLPLFFTENFDVKCSLNEKEIDVVFIGSGHSDRCSLIGSLDYEFKKLGLKSYIKIFFPSKIVFIQRFFSNILSVWKVRDKVTFQQTGFDEVSDIMSRASIVLDITHAEQSGLTMRTIESVGMNQKIITTNKSIKEYDFYCEDMVYVIDREDFKLPNADFFHGTKCYEENIRKKYSLAQWVNTLVGLE